MDPAARDSAYPHTRLLGYVRIGNRFYAPPRLVRDSLK